MSAMVLFYGPPPEIPESPRFSSYEKFCAHLQKNESARCSFYGQGASKMSASHLRHALRRDEMSWADFQSAEEYAYRTHVYHLAESARYELHRREEQER